MVVKEQIGWYNPFNKRFCYLNEREAKPRCFRAYCMPVFIETVAQTAAKAA